MKVFSQEQWCRMCHTQFTEAVEHVVGTRCNPEENDVELSDCPADAVCVTNDMIDEIEQAGKDWYYRANMDDDEDGQLASNAMIAFARELRETEPSRSEIVKALVSEGKA